MKKILFSILILLAAATFGYSQEVISEVQEYISYQDSLFVLKTTRITRTGYEGLNDTTVSYTAPTDTAGLVTQLRNGYINSANTATARIRAASPFKTILSDYAAEKAVLAELGFSLDSMLVDQYANAYTGRWRVFANGGSSFFVDVAKHPTQPGLLRATGTAGEGNFNVLLYGRHFFRITLQNANVQYLTWNGNSTEQPVYQPPATISIPSALVPASTVRMVKVR